MTLSSRSIPRHADCAAFVRVLKNQQGEPAEALRLVRGGAAGQANAVNTLMSHGVILDALKRHEEALASFDRVLGAGCGATPHFITTAAMRCEVSARIAEALHRLRSRPSNCSRSRGCSP